MRYNQRAVDAIASFEEELGSLGLTAMQLHRLNSILNAIEVQVEYGDSDPAILEHLCQALAIEAKACPSPLRDQIRRAFRKCQKVLIE